MTGAANHITPKITILTSLYNCSDFLPGYFKALSLLKGTELIEVLLLHNAPSEGELKIIDRNLPLFDFVRHLIIENREPLYTTWNRGILMAKGKYIAIWNVDDVRFPESILQQAKALDDNPQAAIAYGDIWLSREYAVYHTNTKRTYSPDNNRNKDLFKAYHISCFQMWRKSIHEKIGYYDEQFFCSADFDFQIRAAIHFPLVKTDEILGVYLEDLPHKISSNGRQSQENNIICLRYGALRNLNLLNLHLSRKNYQRDKLLFFGSWHPLMEGSQFGIASKIVDLLIAFFKSQVLLLKRIVKGVIYAKRKP